MYEDTCIYIYVKNNKTIAMYINFFLDDRHSYRLFLIKFPPALVVSSCSSCSCNEKSSCKISSSLEVVDSSVASSSGLSEKKMT